MQESLPVSVRRPRGWNRSTHACSDGVVIHSRRETTVITVIDRLERKIAHTAPKSGVWLKFCLSLVVDACGTATDRPMTTLVRGGPARTYALPRTTKIIGPRAFQDTDAPVSVRLNDGLESLGESCFEYSGLERLVLPASVTSVGERAFTQCKHLKYVDLRAARGLRSLGRHAFYFCTELKQALLNEGLEEIRLQAFCGTGLEAFVAPASLRRIGDMAFSGCGSLGTFRPNEGLLELGRLCLLWTAMEGVKLPPKVRMTPEQFGLDQKDPKELRLPAGLEEVGDWWFEDSAVERVFVPRSVRRLGRHAFAGCERLCEVVLEQGSRLERIGDLCFSGCGLTEMPIPKSLRSVGEEAFCGCERLSRLCIEEGCALEHVGYRAFARTRLAPEQLAFLAVLEEREPEEAEEDREEEDWK